MRTDYYETGNEESTRTICKSIAVYSSNKEKCARENFIFPMNYRNVLPSVFTICNAECLVT